MMEVQVDGDIVAFRAGFGAEHMEYDVTYLDPTFGEEIVITCRYKKEAVSMVNALKLRQIEAEIVPRRVLEPLAHALNNVNTILNRIMEDLNVQKPDLNVWLSGPSEENFRKKIGKILPYKGNRSDAWRPTYEQEIKQFMIKKWDAEVTFGQEADDAMGIAQMKCDFGTSCIASNDKDLDLIPGLHYNFVKGERYVVTNETADWLFWQQMLTGDKTDNILGIPGIGEKKAYAALEEIWDKPVEMEQQAWALYVQTYGWAAWPAFLETGQLLWIRRKENELWTPPSAII